MESHLKTGGEDQYIAGANPLLQVNQKVIDTFKELKLRRTYRYMILRIQGNEIEVEHTGKETQVQNVLSDSECRYFVYDHDIVTDDGRNTSKLYFVSWYVCY